MHFFGTVVKPNGIISVEQISFGNVNYRISQTLSSISKQIRYNP